MPHDMPNHFWNPLLDVPAFPAHRYAALADRIGAIIKTRNDVLLVQAEAILALEAVAASLARPGLKAVNIVTSPYGTWFGKWLSRGGARVRDIVAEPGLPVTAEAVASVLDADPEIAVLALVHAESASGILNPMEEIVALARARGILTVIDAVASVGGHALDVDGAGIDICVIGPQKSLGGPAGVSALSVSPKAWDAILKPGGQSDSVLSLSDIKRFWLDAGRPALPGTPPPLEFFALEAALTRVEAEGIDRMVARHALAAEATRAGLAALGRPLWVEAARASNLVTAARLPDGVTASQVLPFVTHFGMEISPGVGAAADNLLRLNHTGPRARFDIVLGNVAAYGQALRQVGIAADVGAATEAVAARYARAVTTD